MKNKNCIIIHGCPVNTEKAMNKKTRTYDKHWMPWLKKQLENNGIKAENPLMPLPWHPDYEKFKKEFEKYIVNENTVLVGHSCGCAFLVRWLGDSKQKILKLILVAPWKIPQKNKSYIHQNNFYTYEVDKTVKDRVKKIVMFISNDEKDNGKKSLEIFHNALGGEIVNLKNHGHYCLRDMGTEEFPELLEKIIKD